MILHRIGYCLLGLLLLTSCSYRPAEEEVVASRHLIPPQPPAYTIVLDAGHGGKDPGCVSKQPQCAEKELALETVFLLKEQLCKMGYHVTLTRARDVFVELDHRTAYANELDSTVFVSIHYNSAASTKASGIEIFYCDNAENAARTNHSKLLADKVFKQIASSTSAKTRAVKTANYRVIRNTTMPAILIEAGFLTNKEECELLRDPIYLNAIVRAIAQGIDSYLKSL